MYALYYLVCHNVAHDAFHICIINPHHVDLFTELINLICTNIAAIPAMGYTDKPPCFEADASETLQIFLI
jgi:hypothetical protein